ncbi:MAG: hypothetical protein MK098_14505 [Marinovum sp.]|nr:hypothetical protein [Marinovum sp.]
MDDKGAVSVATALEDVVTITSGPEDTPRIERYRHGIWGLDEPGSVAKREYSAELPNPLTLAIGSETFIPFRTETTSGRIKTGTLEIRPLLTNEYLHEGCAYTLVAIGTKSNFGEDAGPEHVAFLIKEIGIVIARVFLRANREEVARHSYPEMERVSP